jgi:carboxymethylenebutenolidase
MSDVTLDVADGTTARAFVARPEPELAHAAPALLLFQEAFGVNAHMRDVAGRFAGQGYVVIAPEMYHRTADPGYEAGYNDFDSVRPHLKALTADGIIADARAAMEWLIRDPAVDSTRIAAVGYCMGGRCAFLANTELSLRAAVSYYGGSIPAGRAAQLAAPQLFFWGGRDQHIPVAQRQALLDALTEANRSYVNVEMSDAGHGFFCDQRPSYHPDAAAESWALTLEFLRRKVN